ncbi:hypothetical protein [Thermomonas sp.]|uniref:hypothetical protein n=1 Tax=Thermomonas sp. TaxID=1971895 RepID=UPI001ED26677|nr:hypothetical protein [Thermomonas sp.]MBK6415896.1 hypothetical protein [Thermomonas sp.]
MKRVLMLAALLGLAGCSQEVPNVPAPAPAPAASTAAAAAAPVTDALPADKVSVALSDVDCSGTPVAVATMGWDAGALAAGGVSVFVESPGNPRKLWVEAGQKDTATTGKWVFEGTQFTLQDRVSGAVLARRAVAKIPCQKQ